MKLDSRLGRPQHFNETFTVTLGDGAENEKGMEIIGTPAETGLSVAQLRDVERRCMASGYKCDWYDLGQLIGVPAPEAAVLVIRGGINASCGDDAHSKLFGELKRMPKDKLGRMKNDSGDWVVHNKHARHNSALPHQSFNPTPPVSPLHHLLLAQSSPSASHCLSLILCAVCAQTRWQTTRRRPTF